MSLRGRAAIVGVAESDLGEVGPGLTPLDLIGQATLRALDDAGLEKGDVDGLFSASAYYHTPTLSVGEYLGIRFAVRKCPYPHGLCRKISWMQQEEALLSRWQFLRLCVAGIAGLSLLSLGGCGGSQGGDEGEKNNEDRKKDEEHGGGGGAGGGY